VPANDDLCPLLEYVPASLCLRPPRVLGSWKDVSPLLCFGLHLSQVRPHQNKWSTPPHVRPSNNEVCLSSKCAPTSSLKCTLSLKRLPQAMCAPPLLVHPLHKQWPPTLSSQAQASMVHPHPLLISSPNPCALLLSHFMRPSPPQECAQVFSSLPLFTQLSQVKNESHPYPFASFSLSLAKPKRSMA
jgi:hypothetical protein